LANGDSLAGTDYGFGVAFPFTDEFCERCERGTGFRGFRRGAASLSVRCEWSHGQQKKCRSNQHRFLRAMEWGQTLLVEQWGLTPLLMLLNMRGRATARL
jgi:hypothetical protein